MTVSSTTSKVSYSGNGSTVAFSVTFYFLAASHLKVVIRSSNGTETVKTLGTHYTVAGDGDPAGGTVTMLTAPASGETIVISRNVPLTQVTDYQSNDPFPAETHEAALDKLTQITQQVQEELTRAIKLSVSNTMTSTEFTVGASARANKVLGFDSAGELAVTQEIGTYRGNWASGTAYQQRDIIKDTSNANIYICVTAHTSSGSQPISSNTDSAKWALLVDAASATAAQAAAEAAQAAAETAQAAAELAETNAETAETNAETAETNAETAATNASNSASAAATSATNASNSATAAATSATSASNSATAAAASYDSFDDRYLGVKSSAPSVDNDGNSLVTGALYFNSTAGDMYVYNGSSWVTVSNTTSSTNAANSATAAATSATNASNSASSASTSATNAANSASSASSSASSASSSASAASTSATNAATSATSASNSASSASTSATNASNSASAASTSETNAASSASSASTSASNASTSATNAANSASSASTSATNASNSATAAQIAQTAAEAARDSALSAYDSFDDRYLGAKTSDPSVDNDGNALIAGALYFNSTDSVMKLYTGSNWVAAYVSGGSYLNATNNLSDLTNVASARTNLGLGTAATTNSTAYATASQGSNADTAYGWGDHASAGYLTTSTAASTYQPLDSDLTTLATNGFGASANQVPQFDASGWLLLGSGWKVKESVGVLYFAVGSTNYMKLDASGNLTVLGNVTANGTI